MVSVRRLLGATTLVLCLAPLAAGGQEPVIFTTPGADDDLVSVLRGASALLGAERDGTTTAQDMFAAARAEYGRLIGALYAQGHYSPVIHVRIDGREAATIAPLDAPATIGRIEVSVDPGPGFVFARASVAPLAPGTDLPPGFATGEPAQSGLVREAVQAGVDGWRAEGHAKAAPAGQRIVADHAARQLSAEVALTPGPRLRFGPLTVEGQDRMKLRRIVKIAGLPEGEVFDPDELRRSAERLRRTGVFRSVSLTEDDRITPPDLLGITATVAEEKPRRYGVGAELSSFDGLDLTGFWMHRNLLGGAERLRIEGEIGNIGAQSSGIDYGIGVTLDRPATFTPDTSLGLSFDLGHLDEEDFTADVAGLGISLTHIFSDTLTGRVGLTYTASEITDEAGTFNYRNLALPIGITWDTRDNKLDATKGFYVDAEAKPFLGFGITDSGTRVKLDARAYRAFGTERPMVLAGRLQAGMVFGSSLLGTPRDDLFYSGGGGTVRGHPYQSLGVNVLRSAVGDFKTGGMAFVAGSVELRAKVTDTIGIVGFVDAGRVNALDFNDGLGNWHAGAGLGVRYATGFGPIRLDVAAPVAGNTGEGVQIYVGIGQSF
jgi:translocation and assembly module TamA